MSAVYIELRAISSRFFYFSSVLSFFPFNLSLYLCIGFLVLQYSPAGSLDWFHLDKNCLEPRDSSNREKTDLEYTFCQVNASHDFQAVVRHVLRKGNKNLLCASPAGRPYNYIFRCVRSTVLGVALLGAWAWHSLSLGAVSLVSKSFPVLGVRLLYIHLFQKTQTICSLSDISFTSAYAHGRLTYSISLLLNCTKLSQVSYSFYLYLFLMN